MPKVMGPPGPIEFRIDPHFMLRLKKVEEINILKIWDLVLKTAFERIMWKHL